MLWCTCFGLKNVRKPGAPPPKGLGRDARKGVDEGKSRKRHAMGAAT